MPDIPAERSAKGAKAAANSSRMSVFIVASVTFGSASIDGIVRDLRADLLTIIDGIGEFSLSIYG